MFSPEQAAHEDVLRQQMGKNAANGSPVPALACLRVDDGVSVAAMATDTPGPDIHRAIDAVWRIEQAKVIAGLARMVRDVGLAEELAQDALIAALEQWPASGIPEKPAPG